MTKRVMIAIPTYSGNVCAGLLEALLGDAAKLRDRGDELELAVEPDVPIVQLARAVLVARFMASDATDLVMVDADVHWEPGALLRLVDHQPDFVITAYPCRCYPVPQMKQFSVGERECGWPPDAAGLVRTTGASLGFARLRRSVIERLVAAHPGLEFVVRSPWRGRVTAWDLFNGGAHKGEYMGEDYAFCRRWMALGGEIWLDPRITMHHTGPGFFTGRFPAFLGVFRSRNSCLVRQMQVFQLI